MEKRKVGILTFSDGRKYIHEDLLEVNWRYQNRLAAALEATGEIEAVAGREIIWTPELAQREGRRLAAEGVDLTICNFAIWTFPHLTAIATRFAPGPYLLFCNLHPSEPGMVAMLSNAYCGLVKDVPGACTHCGSIQIKYFGTGTERVEDELEFYFPNVKMSRIDSDSITKKSALIRLLL